jgi:hypothetical protein
MKPTAYHNCLAWHMRCAEPVRLFPPKPSRFRRLLWLYGIPLFFMVVLSVFGADVVRVVNWGMG